MEMPIMHGGDRYEHVRDLGSDNFGVARLMRNRASVNLLAVKYTNRSENVHGDCSTHFFSFFLAFLFGRACAWFALQIDENVRRGIINHRSLRHPNIIRFKEVKDALTPTHLAIVMEYASEGELFDRICSAGRFNEDEQLISGVSYCHSMQVCHCDLKLENTLLDVSTTPRLKICDFGYSKINNIVKVNDIGLELLTSIDSVEDDVVMKLWWPAMIKDLKFC